MDKLLLTLASVCDQLQGSGFDNNSGFVKNIAHLSAGLKAFGSALDRFYKDKLDQLLSCLRAACKDASLDLVARIHILELIELRALNWAPSEHVEAYYKQKLAEVDSLYKTRTRNQVHGSEGKPRSWPEPTPDYKLTVTVGDQKLSIVGPNAALVKAAKIILEEHSGELNQSPSADMVIPTDRSSPGAEPKLTRSVKVIRQPLFPGAPLEAFQLVEDELGPSKALERRANFAKTNAACQTSNSNNLNTTTSSNSNNSTTGINISSSSKNNDVSTTGASGYSEDLKVPAVTKKTLISYEREFLMNMSKAAYAKKVPAWLEALFVELPMLRKSNAVVGEREE